MGNQPEFKIRTLPRPEKPKKKAESSPRWIIYLGIASCSALTMLLALSHFKPAAKSGEPEATPQVESKRQDLSSVSRHMADAAMKRQMMVRTREFENLNVKADELELLDGYTADADARAFGVQFEQEDTAERLYEDLNGTPGRYADTLPADKINSRLANRRWVNDFERNERITFIKNFIRAAYERGYEVQIDQNLVVVGVTKISGTKKLNIDQVIDKLAKQGL
ncbi:MAG TPA: hypothetical protein PKC28_13935 [Bdellovibrionales bacterium]|nr:hypothetical protein [Bdellovibrionales bacterium]